MKPGRERNLQLIICEHSPMCMYQRMKERSSTQSQKDAFCWAMEQGKKVIGCTISRNRRFFQQRCCFNEHEYAFEKNVLDLVELPKDRKAVGSKFSKQRSKLIDLQNNTKLTLSLRVFQISMALTMIKPFPPVMRSESIRTVIALAAQNGLKLHQMDVTTAFQNGEFDEVVYMKQPEGFIAEGQEHLVCRLKRSIYGLKQSPRCWNQTLDTETWVLSRALVIPASTPPLAVYVDDIVVAGKSEQAIANLKSTIAKQFQVKDWGNCTTFLKCEKNLKTGETWFGALQIWNGQYVHICRSKYQITQSYGRNRNGRFSTLRVCSWQLTAYQSNWTRPDITFPVSNVARFCANPTKQHWTAVKRIMRYLTKPWSSTNCESCVGYSDWAGDVNDRKSTSGYLIKIGGTAVSCRSNKQTCVAMSTAEAEYTALACKLSG